MHSFVVLQYYMALLNLERVMCMHYALSLLHIKIELLKMKAFIKHSLYSKKSANV